MLTPGHVVLGARGGLIVGVSITALLTSGLMRGVDFGLGQTPAHAIGFGGLLALAYLACPRLRRNDIALALVLIAGGVEAVQPGAGRASIMQAWAADAAGLAIIHFAGQIENVRRLARRAPYQTFQDIRRHDRRRRRRQLSSRSQAPIATVQSSK
jgi:hypothetical protein